MFDHFRRFFVEYPIKKLLFAPIPNKRFVSPSFGAGNLIREFG